jgi:hypothetical protein
MAGSSMAGSSAQRCTVCPCPEQSARYPRSPSAPASRSAPISPPPRFPRAVSFSRVLPSPLLFSPFRRFVPFCRLVPFAASFPPPSPLFFAPCPLAHPGSRGAWAQVGGGEVLRPGGAGEHRLHWVLQGGEAGARAVTRPAVLDGSRRAAARRRAQLRPPRGGTVGTMLEAWRRSAGLWMGVRIAWAGPWAWGCWGGGGGARRSRFPGPGPCGGGAGWLRGSLSVFFTMAVFPLAVLRATEQRPRAGVRRGRIGRRDRRVAGGGWRVAGVSRGRAGRGALPGNCR